LNQTAFSFFTAAFSQQLFHSSFFTAHSRTKRTLGLVLLVRGQA
jgi:hypothetical protein